MIDDKPLIISWYFIKAMLLEGEVGEEWGGSKNITFY